MAYLRQMESGLDYELIDFGSGRKLERFGEITVDRPENLANGKPLLSRKYWSDARDGRFDGAKAGTWSWDIAQDKIARWECKISLQNQAINLMLTPGTFKHVGIFPEQEKHWLYLAKNLIPEMRVLNLFAYTGAASLVGALCGADVYHVDASKSAIKSGRRKRQTFANRFYPLGMR